MNDDVTVVISCFNYGAYLTEAVTSAREQRGGPPHVVVVDDGSTDPATHTVLGRLPADVEVVRQANGGVAVARNAGLDRVRTEYAIVLDADDRLHERAIETLRGPLAADPSLGFTFGDMRFFGDWDGVLRMPPYDPLGLIYRHTIGSTALMRRGLLQDGVRYDPEFGGYEDWDFWLAALRHGWEGRRVDAETVFYRRHGDSRHFQARLRYRDTYRQLRRKYPDLYGPAGRRSLAARSRLGRLERQTYRFWWGARPLPARLEIALQSLLWRASSGARSISSPSS